MRRRSWRDAIIPPIRENEARRATEQLLDGEFAKDTGVPPSNQSTLPFVLIVPLKLNPAAVREIRPLAFDAS